MLSLINVCVNYGRLKDDTRTHVADCSDQVVFTWGVLSSNDGAYQKSVRLRLVSDGFSFDSGEFFTSEQRFVYPGAPLPEGKRISLFINVSDNFGNVSETFENYFYNGSVSWHAGFIGSKENTKAAVYLRREFSVEKSVKNAVYYAFAAGYQKLAVNGREIDNAFLDPAFTDFSKTGQYVVYPGVEKHLKAGRNCLGAILGCGWRKTSFETTRPELQMTFYGQPAFSAQLKIEYADGSIDWIVTDGSWQYGYGMIGENDIFDGVTYDARNAFTGWDEPGFEGFSAACVLPPVGCKMVPMVLEPITAQEELRAVSSWQITKNSRVYDFGKNIAGIVKIAFPKNMAAGASVTVYHAEELDEGGDLFTEPLRSAKCADKYIASGDEQDLTVFEPQFTYHGFRYVRVDQDGIDISNIKAVVLRSDIDEISLFRCGEPIINAIHDIVINTERANQHSILTDCPQRDERQGWMNDATVRFEETPYNFDIGRMFPKVVCDIIDAQNKSGSITDTAPMVFGGDPADPVCMSMLVAVDESYKHTGNVELMKKAYPAMCAWENYLLENSEDYILSLGLYGDWAGPDYACDHGSIGDGAISKVTPVPFMSTGYSYFACRKLARFADILGHTDDAALWDKTAENIKAAMLKKWYDPKTCRIATASQACQTFALWLGVIPEGDRAKAAKVLHDELIDKDYMLTTGNLCTRYILEVLTDNGYIDDAWTLLTRQEYPSIGFMLQNEATTVWERFELKKDPGMNSHSHPMYGALDYYFHAYLLGIIPKGKAFEEVLIKPHFPYGLLSAQGSIDTVKGEISVRWMKRYGGTHLFVNVPFGCDASIEFFGKTYRAGSGFHTFSHKDN